MANEFHDFKSVHAAPKMELANRLSEFSELADIRQAVINGTYDEPADDADMKALDAEFPYLKKMMAK